MLFSGVVLQHVATLVKYFLVGRLKGAAAPHSPTHAPKYAHALNANGVTCNSTRARVTAEMRSREPALWRVVGPRTWRKCCVLRRVLRRVVGPRVDAANRRNSWEYPQDRFPRLATLTPSSTQLYNTVSRARVGRPAVRGRLKSLQCKVIRNV